MKFSMRIFFFFMALLAVATALPPKPKPSKTTSAPPKPTQSSCSTGPVQCCQTVESAKDAGFLLSLLGIILQDLDILVGLTCSPIELIGIGGGSCNSNVVCCENNSFGGLISIGCIPIIL